MIDVQLKASNMRHFLTSLRATIKSPTKHLNYFLRQNIMSFFFLFSYLLSSCYLFCLASVYLALYYYMIAHSVAGFVGSPN